MEIRDEELFKEEIEEELYGETLSDEEFIKERYTLMLTRIREIPGELQAFSDSTYGAALTEYFTRTAAFIGDIAAFFSEREDILRDPVLARSWNEKLYAELSDGAYDTSITNPSYLAQQFAHEKDEYVGLLATVSAEIRGMIPYAYEGRIEEITILGELFVQLYSAFYVDTEQAGDLPPLESLRSILYWYAWDYLEFYVDRRIAEQLDPDLDFLTSHILESEKNEDLSYLYLTGEYITENERKLAAFIRSLPREEIERIASACTEGYRRGFAVMRKDLSKKRTVNIRCQAGFERIAACAMKQFEAMGLKSVIYRAPVSFVTGLSNRIGFTGACPSRQYEFDHRRDDALIFNKKYVSRKLEVTRAAYEKRKELASYMGGPAVIEFFGEEPFAPESHKEAPSYTEKQQELVLSYRSEASVITQNYILPEERSFTIIAFPCPSIGEDFEAIFRDVVEINTLDNALYTRIQQTIIDALDTGVKVRIKGENGNRTDLTVALQKLRDPAKETIFENCVSDVNIPAGEVFTSPELTGTEGVLHVTEVFLNELKYIDLELTFKDGMVSDYRCGNFETEEENRKFLQEDLLHQHPSLPMGEFAIGTNTLAYVMSRKYGIGAKLPILIAEKTGPHFAIGDTCYSHEEEHAVYNLNGKEIIARENACSRLRHEDPSKAYFQVHTDITIPYDELGSIDVVGADGSMIRILEHGRFVLPGTEELNAAFA